MAKETAADTGKFLYEEIRDTIRHKIEAGEYPEGLRLPSTRDFVDEFGTTPVTINRALSDLVESGHIYRKAKSGSFVNDRGEWDRMSRRKTGLVGIIAFDTNVSLYWAKAVEAMQDALESRGFHIVVGYSDHRYDKALAYVDDLAEKGIEGLIYVPIDDTSPESYQRNNEEVCERIEHHGIPFLLFDRRLKNLRFSSVTADVYRVTRELTYHLAEAGVKRPICLTLDYSQAIWEREQAFLDTCPLAGMEMSPDRILRYRGSRVSGELGEKLAGLMDSAPEFDGMFIANSGMYGLFLRLEEALGRRYEVPIITFRDIDTPQPDRPIARALQPVYEFGYTAGDMLARMLKGEVPGNVPGTALHAVLPIEVEARVVVPDR